MIGEQLESIVRWIMRDVTYHKHYLATVQLQSGNTVDLLPEDETIRGSGLSGVPLDTLPGVDATVPPGAQVTLYFDGGNPQKPRARWVSGSPISLSLAGGTMPVARVGDTVTVTDPIYGALTGIIIGGAPKVKA